MDLQKFGVDIYLIQVIFGAVDFPAKVVITVTMSLLGRRPSQCGALIIAGVTILANLLVPHGRYEATNTCEPQLLSDPVAGCRSTGGAHQSGRAGERVPGRLLQLLLPLLRRTLPNRHPVGGMGQPLRN